MAAYVIATHHISISRACKVVCLPKSMYYYTRKKNDTETISKLRELAENYPTEGQDLYYSRIRKEGLKWNYKRVRRVYLLLGMNRRRKMRKRIPTRIPEPLVVPSSPLKTWSLDFMSDVLTNKRKFRTLNVIDDYNRKAIAVEVAHSMPATTVTQLLERIIKEHGKPSRFRTDKEIIDKVPTNIPAIIDNAEYPCFKTVVGMVLEGWINSNSKYFQDRIREIFHIMHLNGFTQFQNKY